MRVLKVLAALGLVACAASACKKKEQPAQPHAAYPAHPAPAPAAPPTAGVPQPGVATPATMAPALGFPCVNDAELQCPFGRCLGSRCGGCGSAADCKAGAQCVPTWLGQACLPGNAASPPVAAPPPAPAPAPQPVSGDAFERARQLCVNRTNDYRARGGVAPVSRRPDREGCGDGEARSDAQTRTAHGAFGQCAERSQNECPGWSGSPEDVVERCLAMMFAEGPGSGPAHGHYMNMMDKGVRGVACGMFQTASGELWVVQNFFP